jgi:hypothetical protein
MYIENEDELALQNAKVAVKADIRKARRIAAGTESNEDKASGSGSEDDSSEEEDGDEKVQSVFAMGGAGNPKKAPTAGGSAPEMKKLKDMKSLGDALPAVDPAGGMTRKQREEADAIKAKEDYMKRHLAGQTPEAKAELAALAEVRARREAARLKREAEGRKPGWAGPVASDDSDDSDSDTPKAKGAAVAAGGAKKKEAAPAQLGTMSKEVADKKKAAALSEDTSSAAEGGEEKLQARDIKNMNPTELKEHLKSRNLDLQGAKKDLIKRLTDYEAAR